MATFTWCPDYPPTEESQPRVRRTQLGDGYEHRLRFGLNTDLKTWQLEFRRRTNSETSEIDSFLEARGSVESFTWTPPLWNSPAAQFVCDQWSITAEAYNINNIRATFRQVPEPS